MHIAWRVTHINAIDREERKRRLSRTDRVEIGRLPAYAMEYRKLSIVSLSFRIFAIFFFSSNEASNAIQAIVDRYQVLPHIGLRSRFYRTSSRLPATPVAVFN